MLAVWLAAPSFAFRVAFDDVENLLTEFSLSSSRVQLSESGVNGTTGVTVGFLEDASVNESLTYRHEEFDTGLICCVGDPVVPLSVMFKYEQPDLSQVPANYAYPFASVYLRHSLSSGSKLTLEVSGQRQGEEAPLDFRLGLTASSTGRSSQIEPLLDGHWYRLAGLLGARGAGTFAVVQLDDLGFDGAARVSVHSEREFLISSYNYGVNGTYAGFGGTTVAGGGAVVFDEFHTMFGDFNLDGVVDAADYAIYREAFGTRDHHTNPSGDHIVNEDDYRIWRTSYGRSAFPQSGASPAGMSAPTPNTVVLLAATGLLVSRRAGLTPRRDGSWRASS